MNVLNFISTHSLVSANSSSSAVLPLEFQKGVSNTLNIPGNPGTHSVTRFFPSMTAQKKTVCWRPSSKGFQLHLFCTMSFVTDCLGARLGAAVNRLNFFLRQSQIVL